MSTNDLGPELSSPARPISVTLFAVFLWTIGLGQSCTFGIFPSINWVGISLGVVSIIVGSLFLGSKRLWRTKHLISYSYFVAGAMYIVIAINGSLGLGIAQVHLPSIAVWAFVLVGLIFGVVGLIFWRMRLPNLKNLRDHNFK